MIRTIDLAKAVIRDLQLYLQLFNQWKEADYPYTQLKDEIFPILKKDLINWLQILNYLATEETALTAHILCENTQASIDRISATNDIKEQISKVQYELIPLLAEILNDLYFWGLCYPDEKKMHQYYQQDMNLLCPLPNNKKAKYELSILISAYNHLEYSKLCIDYLRKYLPKDLNYELILLNHGSNDGTKEYFETLNPTKQIDFVKNNKSLSILSRVIEGRYVMFLSNDVLMMPNVVENLLTCLKSADDIACVMPTCPNISNYSMIDIKYKNEDEMIAAARKNNISNSRRWIQRSRLTPPVLMARADEEAFHVFLGYRFPFFEERFKAFSDDAMSMVARRAGKKCILAEDSFVYHFGSITVKKQDLSMYQVGKSIFEQAFGINPWGRGACYDKELFSMVPFISCSEEVLNLLAVNLGLGDDLFQLKSRILQFSECKEVNTTHFEDIQLASEETKQLVNQYQTYQKIDDILDAIQDKYYHYMIVTYFNDLSQGQFDVFYRSLAREGVLIINNLAIKELDLSDLFYNQNQHWTYIVKK